MNIKFNAAISAVAKFVSPGQTFREILDVEEISQAGVTDEEVKVMLGHDPAVRDDQRWRDFAFTSR